MLKPRKLTRDFLLYTDRETFLDVVYKSKVTPRQKEIIYRYILDKKDCSLIADELAVSTETIKSDIQRAYDLIYKYLLTTEYIPKHDHLLDYNIS